MCICFVAFGQKVVFALFLKASSGNIEAFETFEIDSEVFETVASFRVTLVEDIACKITMSLV